MGGRLRAAAALAAVIVIVLVVVVATAGGSGTGSSATRATASHSDPDAVDATLLRRHRPQAVEPVAGESAADAALPASSDDAAPAQGTKSSKHSKDQIYSERYDGQDTGPTKDAAISNADVLKNGIALPPIEAPPEVREIVESGNQIARTPYLWGGGHGKWLDKGYDCSGSISYSLASAGLLSSPQTSGALEGWGKPGKGKWITVYASATHVFMVVAGVRFDTGGTRVTGSRWQASMRPTNGFVARHPVGL